MSATIYLVQNAAVQTTAQAVKNATGVTIKTQLQILTPSTVQARIVEWGCSFDTPASASIINAELITTGAVAATVTSFTPQLYNDPHGVAALSVGGTAATGFNASAEGTVATSQTYDLQTIVPPAQYVKQWPLGREPLIPSSTAIRVRVTASVTCNCYVYILWEE